jgi:NTE family protein
MKELKLGLALGAGGTKGAAHVGVMRVLDDAGIKVDVVAGTSIGSLYGGAYAVGRTSHEMEEGIRTCPSRDVVNFFRRRLKIRDNNRLARRFYEALAGYNIEDLPVKFAATASDIVEMKHVVIDRGPIIDAIEASIAIPVIARPVAHQGRYLLDGGFWDRAPVDAAAQLGADVVVAVQLGRPLTLPVRLHAHGTRFAHLIDRVSLSRTIAGVPFTVGAVSRPLVPGRTANVVIKPRLPRVGGASPWQMVRCLDAGMEAAEAALPAIRALLAGEAPAAVAEEFAPQSRLVTRLGEL